MGVSQSDSPGGNFLNSKYGNFQIKIKNKEKAKDEFASEEYVEKISDEQYQEQLKKNEFFLNPEIEESKVLPPEKLQKLQNESLTEIEASLTEEELQDAKKSSTTLIEPEQSDAEIAEDFDMITSIDMFQTDITYSILIIKGETIEIDTSKIKHPGSILMMIDFENLKQSADYVNYKQREMFLYSLVEYIKFNNYEAEINIDSMLNFSLKDIGELSAKTPHECLRDVLKYVSFRKTLIKFQSKFDYVQINISIETVKFSYQTGETKFEQNKKVVEYSSRVEKLNVTETVKNIVGKNIGHRMLI